MKKIIFLLSNTLFLTLISVQAFAQTLSLNGQLTLDVFQPNAEYDLEVTVRNHGFVVIPPAFTILRPVMSQESTNVPFATRLFEGQILNKYMVSNILPDPVDYSVQIKCLSCSDFIPTQYYSPSGNALGLANSVYIDPEDFTENLNITLITRAFIKGQIKLDKEVSEDLEINLSVLSKNITNFTYETAVITLPAGETTIDYQLIGLSRNIGNDEYQVSVQCLNCFGASSGQKFHPIALSPNENHLNIDFEIANAVTQPTSSLAAIIQLLLAEDEE